MALPPCITPTKSTRISATTTLHSTEPQRGHENRDSAEPQAQNKQRAGSAHLGEGGPAGVGVDASVCVSVGGGGG